MAVIFISRGTMSGVRKLVECLHDEPVLRFVSREDLVDVVNRHGEIATRVMESLDRADRAYEQFSTLRRAYVVLMRQALLEEIAEDGVVYHGYSGQLLLPRLPHFLRVRIEAPIDLRLSLTMERLECDEETARDYIHDEDERRARWARFMYGQGIGNPQLYDIVVNLRWMKLADVCHLLMTFAADPEHRCCEAARQQMERLRVAASVEAALVCDPRTHALEVGATADDGRVALVGPYLEPDALGPVLEIARAAAAGRQVDYRPGYAPYLSVTP
jgi:hypothetical protein